MSSSSSTMKHFETVPLHSTAEDGTLLEHRLPHNGGGSAWSMRGARTALVLLALTSAVSLALSIAALTAVELEIASRDGAPPAATGSGSSSTPTPARAAFVPIRKIAFGSCTSYDLRPQSIWKKGVIPVQPDAWIWLGDFAYLDRPPIDCSQAASYPGCSCEASFMRSAPGQCFAGDADFARSRWIHAVHAPDYREFLDFMCPGREAGDQFPPTGSDPGACPRPILGVYDDHDWGWNNGNGRLPRKDVFKEMFLDAIGEPRASARRGATEGIQTRITLDGGVAGAPEQSIDVLLLDERWYREALPCSLRSAWCEGVLASANGSSGGSSSSSSSVAWCSDFLRDDGATGRGACCAKDDLLAAWCAQDASRSDPLWRQACDPTDPQWASSLFFVSPGSSNSSSSSGSSSGSSNSSGSGSGGGNPTLLRPGDAEWDSEASHWPRLLQAADSPVCEVLGMAQRQWLRQELAASTAPLKIVASGSVPLGSVGWVDPVRGACSEDDWNCWQPAQLNFIHTLANAGGGNGCVVVLTGDYHFSDIKVVKPNSSATAYAQRLQAQKLQKHLYQVMASGMTSSTARHSGSPCKGSYREDLVGLRPLGACSYMAEPNFGLLEVDWGRRLVHLSIRDADGGGVAVDDAGVPQELWFSLSTCAPVPAPTPSGR